MNTPQPNFPHLKPTRLPPQSRPIPIKDLPPSPPPSPRHSRGPPFPGDPPGILSIPVTALKALNNGQ
eukprot:1253409-Amorphochlora_amoeboformis.AAC.1